MLITDQSPGMEYSHSGHFDTSTDGITSMMTSTAASASTPISPPAHVQHIWIVGGPAGCGKSTVAGYLAEQLSVPYIEGDDFHSKANKDKMSNGIPLTDQDRWDWLIALRNEALQRLESHPSNDSVVVTCSALKRKYRDVIRVAHYDHPSVQVHFIYLKVDEATLQKRVAARVGHYMKENMVHSQLTELEEPKNDENDVLTVDVTKDKEIVKTTALDLVKKKLAEYGQSQSQPSHQNA